MSKRTTLILASGSPRRSELLQQIGVQFRVMPVEVDETPWPEEQPHEYVLRMARTKASVGSQQSDTVDSVVLGADTVVVCDDLIMGKPSGFSDARDMLRRLSGKAHTVLTAVAVTDGNNMEYRIADSQVTFREITESEINRYWQTGEPCDKAGGYAIQGKGAIFVSQISGSYSGVVGLPLMETCELLRIFEVPDWAKSQGVV